MNKNTVRYVHSVVGEIFLQAESKAATLLKEKKGKELDALLIENYRKCYGHTTPIKDLEKCIE
jgi:hypothetical protein